jgi:hypothetical protein
MYTGITLRIPVHIKAFSRQKIVNLCPFLAHHDVLFKEPVLFIFPESFQALFCVQKEFFIVKCERCLLLTELDG